jgi:hypothetical protein
MVKEYTPVISLKGSKTYNLYENKLYYIKLEDKRWINSTYARNYFYIYTKDEDKYTYRGLLHNSSVMALEVFRENRINSILND